MNKLTSEQYSAARLMIDEEIIGALDQHKGKILDSWYDKLASRLQFQGSDEMFTADDYLVSLCRVLVRMAKQQAVDDKAKRLEQKIEKCDVFGNVADLRCGAVPVPTSAPRKNIYALVGDSMTVSELIEHLKTLPQDYIVKSGTVNDLADEDVRPGFVIANHERKVVII
jgi:hypothetical protein